MTLFLHLLTAFVLFTYFPNNGRSTHLVANEVEKPDPHPLSYYKSFPPNDKYHQDYDPDFNMNGTFPAQFEQGFNASTFCRSNQTLVSFPPTSALFPVEPKHVYDLIGNFFNNAWVGVPIVHVIGHKYNYDASRWFDNNQYIVEEVLAYYALNTTSYAFQRVTKTGTTIEVLPGWFEVSLHSTDDLLPMCGGTASQFGYSLTMCFSGPGPIPQLIANVTAGEVASLQQLWKNFLPNVTYNPNLTCSDVKDYKDKVILPASIT